MVNRSGLTPVEFFVVVELDDSESVTKGGIILPSTATDRDKLATQEGTLVAVSPHAFSYADNWPEGSVPEVGQRVLFKKYAGALHTRRIDGKPCDFRLLNDKDVIAIVAEDAPPIAAAA
jgi:co-chaperonin GroES (HSP10)